MSVSYGFLPNIFVMTFSVNGIKEENDEKYNVEMLVCVDASSIARKILETTNILILSVKEFSQDKTLFGDIYFQIEHNFQTIEIVTKYADIQEACNFFTFIGFEIKTINSYSKPLPAKEVEAIISKWIADAASKKNIQKLEAQQTEQSEKKIYSDENLESAKKMISRVFEKVDETLKRSDGKISIQDMKKMKSLTEELKKLRMGTNFEKIRETIEEIFKLIETMNDDYYASIQNPNDTIISDSVVTPVDVDKELERMENIRILKSLGAKISLKNQDYSVFGSSAIFRKFLQKDLLLKVSDITNLLYYAFDLTELVMLIILVLLGVYATTNDVFLFSTNGYGLAFSLMSVGIRSIGLFIANSFKKKIFGRLLLFILCIIILHYIGMRAITTNFAL